MVKSNHLVKFWATLVEPNVKIPALVTNISSSSKSDKLFEGPKNINFSLIKSIYIKQLKFYQGVWIIVGFGLVMLNIDSGVCGRIRMAIS